MPSKAHTFFALIALGAVGCHLLVGADAFRVGEDGLAGQGGTGGGAGAASTSTGSGGGGGQGGQVPCHLPGLVDDFGAGSIGPLWAPYEDPGTSLGLSGGKVYFQPASDLPGDHWVGLTSGSEYDLRDCAVWLEVPRVLDAAAPGGVYFELWRKPGAHLTFLAAEGMLSFAARAGGNDIGYGEIPYDADQHRWWRIREEQGTTYFETSADAKSWVSQLQVSSPAYLQQVSVGFGAGTWAPAIAPGRAEVDNVDLVP